MICLGFEGTAHTFSASVVTAKGKILSDVRDMYVSKDGGIIPSELARHHKNVKDRVIQEAIEKSKQKKFDLISYSRGPGFPSALSITMKAAQELSKGLNVPILGVNHCIGHLASADLFTKAKDPVYVYVSGANTQIIALEGKRYRIFGETMDTALGNALDKFGRVIGLGFPAGPKIEELAKKGKYIELPYIVKGMDLSYSGIVTKVEELYKKGASKEDLCYSMQETGFSMLVEVTERAMAHCNKNECVLIGGVAANKRLVKMLEKMCKARGARFYSVPIKYAGDNASFIAWEGLKEYKANIREEKSEIRPYERTDEVEVRW